MTKKPDQALRQFYQLCVAQDIMFAAEGKTYQKVRLSDGSLAPSCEAYAKVSRSHPGLLRGQLLGANIPPFPGSRP